MKIIPMSGAALLAGWLLLGAAGAVADPGQETGVVTGRVLDENGKPAGGIRIVAWPELRGPGVIRVEASAVSEADGGYRLTGLRPGEYRIRPLEAFGKWHWRSEVGARVPARGPAAARDLRLVPAAHVVGTVVDAATGEPLPGRRIGFRRQVPGGRMGGELSADAQGRFRLTVPAGKTELYVATPLRADGLTRSADRRYSIRGAAELKPGETVFRFRVDPERFDRPLPEPE